MAVKDWHAGQLVMVLIGSAVITGVGWLMADHPMASPSSVAVATVFLLGGVTVAVVVMWKWFGARQKPKGD